MSTSTLRDRQRPLKQTYRQDPTAARVTSRARATVDQQALTATVPTWSGDLVAGLHPSTGGEGDLACSADVLLEALVACAGVTLAAVATSMGVRLHRAEVWAEGAWDARGTLAVDRDAPVGLTDVDLVVDVELEPTPGADPEAEVATVARLLELTERYCVVARTLADPPRVGVRRA